MSATARTVGGVLAAFLFGAGMASAAVTVPDPAPHPAGPELSADDAATYLDGFMPFALERGNIAGAVVVVVKDGQILVEKGYGVADMARRTPVDPGTTLFRPGSVSKLFTWTAIMQLVEQGKLDLDTDIDTYLDFHIPATWPAPITLRNLMTHTSGFEETIKRLITDDPHALLPLDALLKAWVPERIFPPGEVSAYSNYGAALAGYIVQRVSGEKFEAYVARHIFEPLGMTHSTFVQPLPEALAKDMSKGYLLASDPPVPYELVGPGPAGSLASTGDDMARFMIAQLHDGAHGDARILQRETAELMHRTAYTPVPPLPGMALGFYHEDRNGHEIIGHAGDTNAFHSDLHLVLDADVGLFLSFNSAGENGAAHPVREALFHGFVDRYFPAPVPEAETLPSAAQDAQKLVGTYESSRRADSNFIRLASVIGGPTSLAAESDGTITFSAFNDFADVPKHWREVAPDIWQDVNGRSRLVAIVRDGRVEKLMTDDLPPVFVFTPVRTLAAAPWNRPLLFATLGLLLVTALAWPGAALLRCCYDRPFALSGMPAVIHRLSRSVAVLDLVFLGGWCGVILYGLNHLPIFDTPLDPLLRLLQVMGVVGAVGTVFPLWRVYEAWAGPTRSWWTRLASVIVALACVATVWFAFSQRLLTLGLDY
jgi:CubicO group peptidase (beta-lactamase class C family)